MTDQPKRRPEEYRLAIRRPVTMAMLFLTLIVFGWRSYQQLPVNLMPDISYPTLTVRTEYEGAAPEDVEKLVTRPLEEMLSIVSGMVEISSISSPGVSEIILEFTWDTDMNTAQQDVRDRLDVFDPPKEVTEKPVILRYDPTLDPVMRVAITPGESMATADGEVVQKSLTAIRDAAERHLKSDLEAETGIAQVLVKGGQEEEIQILVDSERLKNLGLTLQDISNALAQQNINLSGGRLQEGKTEYLVRTLNEYQSIDEIAASIIPTATEQQLQLRDVADVFMGTKDRESIVHIDGNEAVSIEIYKEGDANTVEVAGKVKRLLGFDDEAGWLASLWEKIQARRTERARDGDSEAAESAEAFELLTKRRNLLDRLPDDIDLTLMSDQSRFIVGAIDEVQEATIGGGILALIILFLFLREIKATFIIGIAIPISIIATFIPMFMRDISLNIMSLGGLALGVGMLVDNSIVVLESIFRCKEEGDGIVDAAERGTQEVGSAVTASTLTTISVFFPIAFVEGIAGQLFGDLALTVTFSLLASLLTALYFIPLVASRQSVALKAERQVVWMLRAYREGRDSADESRSQAVLGMLPRGFRYILEYFRESTWDTFGPSLNAIRSAKGGGFKGALSAVAGFIALPLLAILYVLQVALKIVATVFVTALFLVTTVLFALFLLIRKVLGGVMWVPLQIFEVTFNAVRDVYGVVLEHALRFGPVGLIAVAALAAHATFTATRLGTELIPPMKQGEFGIRMEARAGTRLEETAARAKRIEEIVRTRDDVQTVSVQIGEEDKRSNSDRGENIAEFSVLLKNPNETAAFQDEIIEELRQEIASFATEEITFTLPSLFSFKTAIELQVVGDDLNVLKEVGRRALEAVRSVPGVEDPELSVKSGYPEVIIELDRELLASKGLQPGQVAQRLRGEVQGEVATKYNSFGEKIDIRVRTDKQLLSSVEDLRKMSVSAGAVPVPLEDVAIIREQEGPSEIRRIDQRQVVLISANVEGRDLGAVSADIMRAVENVDRPRDYYFLPGGQTRELETSYNSLMFALGLAIFLVYVVMACQFESIWHPALVMFSVPLAFIGVVYALYYAHMDLSIMVFLGGIILAGIVVNDAIVLVDYVNQLRRRGMAKRSALVHAGKVRLRPIIMTTVTTVLGLLPMILSSGDGSEMRRPMAVTVMAGLSSATILTLIIIPMVYDIFGGRDTPPEEAA